MTYTLICLFKVKGMDFGNYSISQKVIFKDLGVIKNLQDLNSSQTGWDDNVRDFE